MPTIKPESFFCYPKGMVVNPKTGKEEEKTLGRFMVQNLYIMDLPGFIPAHALRVSIINRSEKLKAKVRNGEKYYPKRAVSLFNVTAIPKGLPGRFEAKPLQLMPDHIKSIGGQFIDISPDKLSEAFRDYGKPYCKFTDLDSFLDWFQHFCGSRQQAEGYFNEI